MRHAFMVTGLVVGMLSAAAFAAPAASAEPRVAVADSQAALMNSDAAKKVVLGLQTELKVQRERMAQLKTEIEGLEAKMQKNATVMTDKEKKDIQKQGEGKFQEYNNLAQTIKERTGEAQNALLQKMIPKMEAIIDAIQKAEHYNIIIEKKNVIFADPSIDLTKKITEQLNAAK